MSDQQLYDAIQRLHELTQQNAPESAGTAWCTMFDEIIAQARMNTRQSAKDVIITVLETSDIPLEELLNETA